jgi:nucleosome binding factor SPN SPT16 subunit
MLRISSIEKKNVDVDDPSSVDIPLSVGPVNLNWGPIMKTINDSPYEFFQQGGWSFLGGASAGDNVSAFFDE